MLLLPTSGNSPLTTVAQYTSAPRPMLPTGSTAEAPPRPMLPTGSPLAQLLPTAPRPTAPTPTSPTPLSGSSPYAWSSPAELKQRLYDLAHPAPPPPPVVPDTPLAIDFMDPNFDWGAYFGNNFGGLFNFTF